VGTRLVGWLLGAFARPLAPSPPPPPNRIQPPDDRVASDFGLCWNCPLIRRFFFFSNCSYAEPDRVPRMPDRSALPARGAQRLLRGVPGRYHRAATRYVPDRFVSFRPSLVMWQSSRIRALGSAKQLACRRT
jgi:hypothetical protein